MPAHRLAPLLQPRSIAVVGASARAGSPGNEVLVNLRKGDYRGQVYVINPARDVVEGHTCFASLADLPEVPQHVVFAVNDSRLEACFDEAVALGVEAATVFSGMVLPGEATPDATAPDATAPDAAAPGLSARIQRKAKAAGLLLHGGNSMGFFNFHDRVWLSGFDTRMHERPGNVVLLSQSGAGMSGILDCEERLDFLFAASTGQELCLSVEDYLDYVLDLPQTRVVGLFLETSRYPQRMIAALQKAQRRQIPIVVVKVGKTELSARLAVSHSGALAGSDAVFDALFDRFGLQRVQDMAQMAATLILFAQSGPLPPGGLATLHDSGGERQLAIDLAQEVGLDYPPLSEETVARLEAILDHGLPAVNPLDAWGSGGVDAANYMESCFTALMSDPGVALGAVVHDRGPRGAIYPSYLQYLRGAREATGKTVCLVANWAGSGNDSALVEATREGLPVIDGLREFQVAVRCVLAYRDFLVREALPLPPAAEPKVIKHWRKRLHGPGLLDEASAGQLLRDFGIPMVVASTFDGPDLPGELISEIRFPVVLKTAAPGISHKSDVGGVILDIEDEPALVRACRELTGRLGPKLLLAPMENAEGVEMILGIARDDQFGPTVVLGFGGVYAEVLRDTVLLLPPFGAAEARRALSGLKMYGLLGAVRGRQALAVDMFCEVASRLSMLAVELEDCVAEVDINPVLLMVEGCIGLDALVIPRRAADG